MASWVKSIACRAPSKKLRKIIAERFRAGRRKAGQRGENVIGLDRLARMTRPHARHHSHREGIAQIPREQRVDHRSLVTRLADDNRARVSADRLGFGIGQPPRQRIGARLQPIAHVAQPGMGSNQPCQIELVDDMPARRERHDARGKLVMLGHRGSP